MFEQFKNYRIKRLQQSVIIIVTKINELNSNFEIKTSKFNKYAFIYLTVLCFYVQLYNL